MPKKTDIQIQSMLEAGKSPRFRRIETYQKYWDGTVYEGRVPFLDQGSATPLLERAPCVVYPIVRAAASSITSMALGLGKFPEILSLTGEDDTQFDSRFGLSVDESVTLDAGVKHICEQARLSAVSMELCQTALVSGTAVPLVSLNKGKIKVSQLDPKTCDPTFNAKDQETLDQVEVCYRYLEDYWEPTEQAWCKRVMQYRRVIDKTSDTTFVPVEVQHDKHFPIPSAPDKNKTIKHGFGFCPVLWYARGGGVCASQDYDGKPIHWGLAGQLDALHFAYSQRHRAALYAGEPQLWETGVDDQDLASRPMGRLAAAPQPTASNPQGKPGNNGWSFGTGGGGQRARKKGPGTIWSSANPDAKVGLLTLPGDALKAIDLHAADLRVKICEALGITFVDPSQLKGAGDISGKTLAFIFAHQVATCNALREDFGRCLLIPLLNLIYRIILSPAASGLYLADVDALTTLLKKFQAPVGEKGELQWFDPAQKLEWGPYFEASDVDEATRTATAMQTWQAGGIQLKTAVQHIKDMFGIRNVDQYVAELLKENAQKDAQEVAKAGQLASVTGKAAPGGKKGKGPFAKIDEPSAQAESASSNPLPKRQSPETRSWRKPSKRD